MSLTDPLQAPGLAPSIRSRFVDNGNGLRMHVLEAGEEGSDRAEPRPCLLLLHGFPELAYSWRKVMVPLAQAGYRVIAPDQRGYGRTTGWENGYDAPLEPFGMLNLVRDVLGLLRALGVPQVAAVIGHDFGSPVAAWCALIRPDVFRSVVLMSAPFAGPPAAPAPVDPSSAVPASDIHRDLAALARPRKHYQWYYSTRQADAQMRCCEQGLHNFLRAYYHHKSADWPGNRPFTLRGWSAEELAKMPTYYVMDLDQDMAQTVAREMPSDEQIAANHWLPDDELRVYSEAFAATTFQGGLQWYRCNTQGLNAAALQLFAGRSIDVPACFIAGASDWGVQQRPGDLEKMRDGACTRYAGTFLLPGAGHWVQQEQPAAVIGVLLPFLQALASS